jgi:hypothetical protein
MRLRINHVSMAARQLQQRTRFDARSAASAAAHGGSGRRHGNRVLPNMRQGKQAAAAPRTQLLGAPLRAELEVSHL